MSSATNELWLVDPYGEDRCFVQRIQLWLQGLLGDTSLTTLTREDLQEKVARSTPNAVVIWTHCGLPARRALQAFETVRRKCPKTPVVLLVVGAMASEAVQRLVEEHVMEDRPLYRLGEDPAVISWPKTSSNVLETALQKNAQDACETYRSLALRDLAVLQTQLRHTLLREREHLLHSVRFYDGAVLMGYTDTQLYHRFYKHIPNDCRLDELKTLFRRAHNYESKTAEPPLKALLLDDDACKALWHESLAPILRRVHLQIDYCESLSDGIRKLQESGYSLVLLDLCYGAEEIEGRKTLEQLRETVWKKLEARGQFTPVVIFTNSGAAIHVREAFAYETCPDTAHRLVRKYPNIAGYFFKEVAHGPGYKAAEYVSALEDTLRIALIAAPLTPLAEVGEQIIGALQGWPNYTWKQFWHRAVDMARDGFYGPSMILAWAAFECAAEPYIGSFTTSEPTNVVNKYSEYRTCLKKWARVLRNAVAHGRNKPQQATLYDAIVVLVAVLGAICTSADKDLVETGTTAPMSELAILLSRALHDDHLQLCHGDASCLANLLLETCLWRTRRLVSVSGSTRASLTDLYKCSNVVENAEAPSNLLHQFGMALIFAQRVALRGACP